MRKKKKKWKWITDTYDGLVQINTVEGNQLGIVKVLTLRLWSR